MRHLSTAERHIDRVIDTARELCATCGGVIVPIEKGRLVTAVHIGTDDFGNAIVAWSWGTAVAADKQYRTVHRFCAFLSYLPVQ